MTAYAISGVVATEVVIREYGKTTNGYRIESGGQTALPVAQSSFQVRSHYLDKIAVLLAGHAAEELFFDEASDGAGLVAGSDLEQVRKILNSVDVQTAFDTARFGVFVYDRSQILTAERARPKMWDQ